jgi:hypothetical protein
MDHHIITDDQVEAFERDGVVTVDTPWSGKLIEDVSEIMDRQLALYVDEVTQSRIPAKQRNLPGQTPKSYRIGLGSPLEAPYIRMLEDPFLEVLAKRMLHSDSVNLVSVEPRNNHPEPTTEVKIREHTDMTVSMADLASTPRRMSVSLFVWIADVDDKCAPLMVRPGSHRQIAESMGDNPRYIHGPWDRNNYINVPDETSLPLFIPTWSGQYPELDYADLVPCVARAGQVTVLNVATIHSATTNIGQTNRKTVNITMWPSSVEIGETKSRRSNRLNYVGELKTILSPGRLSILPD